MAFTIKNRKQNNDFVITPLAIKKTKMENQQLSGFRHWKLGFKISLPICKIFENTMDLGHMSHSQMLGKVESGEGPIFKVVLEC